MKHLQVRFSSYLMLGSSIFVATCSPSLGDEPFIDPKNFSAGADNNPIPEEKISARESIRKPQGMGSMTKSLEVSDLSHMINRLSEQVKNLNAQIQTLKNNQEQSVSQIQLTEEIDKIKKPANIIQADQQQKTSEQIIAKTFEDKKDQEKSDIKPNEKKGEINIPGTDTRLKIYGYVKIDAIYDAGVNTGDSSVIPNLALKEIDASAARTGGLRAHAKQTRFGFKSTTPTAKGDLSVVVEGDFFGSNNFGNNISRAASPSSTGYNLRLRHAYGVWNKFLVGQYFSNFSDYETIGYTVEFNGPSGINLTRAPQARYTFDASNQFKVSMALEASHADYTESSTSGSTASARTTATMRGEAFENIGNGFSNLPDFTINMRYGSSDNRWMATLRGMARQIRVKLPADPESSTPNSQIDSKKFGYGVGASFKIKTIGNSNFFTQFNLGKGIGRYIFDLVGQGAAVNYVTHQMKNQFGWGGLFGYEQHFTESVRANVIWSMSGIKLADIYDPQLRVNKRLRAYFFNVIYNPMKNIEFGLEYAYMKRETTQHKKGVGHRIQFGALYRF